MDECTESNIQGKIVRSQPDKPRDNLEELKNYEKINAEFVQTMAKLQKEKTIAKKENKLRKAEYNRNRNEVSELKKKFAKQQQMNKEHIRNLKARSKLFTNKTSVSDAGIAVLTKSGIKQINDSGNKSETTVNITNNNSSVVSMVEINSISNSKTATINSNVSTTFQKLPSSQFEVATKKRKDKTKLAVVTVVNEVVKSVADRSIVSDNEAKAIPIVSSRPRRNTGSVNCLEPTLKSKLRHPRI